MASLVAASVPGLARVSAAAVVEPAPPRFEVTIFPQRDFVSVNWDGAGKALSFDLTRNGVVVGHAESGQQTPALTTDPIDNILEVNHPGGLCWAGSTPDVLPGDRLVVTESGTANGVAATTLNITAQHAQEIGTDIVVHGTALLADGRTPMDLASIEQRIVNPTFLTHGIGKRDIRATSDGDSLGLVTADPLVPGGWVATYSSLTAEQRSDAIAGETRGMAWQATNAAGDRLGVTIFEAGLAGGPGMPECPAQASYSVVGTSPRAVNTTNIGTGLTLSGASQDASSVTVTLNDSDPTTAPLTATATPTPATGAQSYSVAFTGAEIEGLSDGSLTATSSFTIPTGTISGSGTTVLKDTVVPGTPSSDTAPGQYDVPQRVMLTLPAGEDPASVIRYTTDGSPPTAASSTVQPLVLSSSRTLRAAVFDTAGNMSNRECPGPACWAYFIEPTITSPSTPDLATTSDTGQSHSDDITNAASPVISGSGTPGATVDLVSGAAILGSTIVTPGGLWSISTAPLTPGLNMLAARAHGAHQPTHRVGPALAVIVDRIAPRVSARAPGAGTVRMLRGANLTIRFSERVAPSSVNLGTVVLRKASGGPAVRRTLRYRAATRSLTVNPGGSSGLRLAPHTSYRVSLGSGIKDVAGNSLAATSWRFRTR